MSARLSSWSTATTIVRAVARGQIRVEAVVRAAIERIAAREPAIHAWEAFDSDYALAQARALDARQATGVSAGPLAGVPLAVKDIMDTADLPTGYGSPIYRGSRPQADAQCVALARGAGVVVMGKTVTTEFAYFAPGPTANPWNIAHTPGGSSSGSAAAVADGMVPLAFGTQTAGSLIRPASYCGVFALKPTFGALSLRGVKSFAPSLDTLGWLARSADDLELMRCALAHVPFEPLDVPAPTALRLGVCRTHEWPMLDAGGAQAWEQVLGLTSSSRMHAQAVGFPVALTGLVDAQKIVMAYEAARSLTPEWRDQPGQLSQAILVLLETGRSIEEDDYRRAQELAQTGRLLVNDMMRESDALLVPSAPGEAPRGLAATGDPIFSRVWTLLGLPCVNVPGLQGPNGLPIGMQLVGHAGRERALLAAAASLHRVLAPDADAGCDESRAPEARSP